MTNFVSEKLSTNMSDWDLNLAVRGFYSTYIDAWITTTKTLYDADGNVTTDGMNATTISFSI